MTVDLLDERAEDIAEVIVAWLTPLGRTATDRQAGDALPFRLVRHITGPEDADLGLADPVVSIHTLCDKASGRDAAKTEADKTHRRMLELARYHPPITLTDGRKASVDYVTVVETPIWVAYESAKTIRKVGRYQIGLSYSPAP